MLIARRRDQSKHPQLWDGLAGAWYPGAGPSGNTLYDLSGRDNHGTLTNMDAATDWVVNRGQMVLDFDGTNDYINVPSALSSLSGKTTTLSLWVKLRSGSTFGGVLFGTNTGSSVFWQVNSNSSVFWVMGASINISGVNLWDNTLHHIAAVSDGTTASVFVDGKIVGFNTVSATSLVAGAKNFVIGDWIGGLGGSFRINVQLNDILIYNRALHADEIKLLSQRPGIAYEPKRRVFYSIPSSVKAWLFRRQSQIIGGGLG